MLDNRLKIILTGGGTGGHISPIVAIFESLNTNRRAKILYVGSRNGLEKQIARKNSIPFKGLVVGKWRNYFSLSNFWDLIKTLIGIVQALFIIVFFKPNVIFSKGGYVSFPVLFWAKIFKIHVVMHESDLIMGKANLWAASFAKKICLGFPVKYYENINNLDASKMVYTGTPVSKNFYHTEEIKKDIPVILIIGGSQGSQKINEIIHEILSDLLKNYEIHHIVGEKNYEVAISKKINNPLYFLYGFTDNVPQIMKKADLIVSRASASTLAEISALGKASVLIPLASGKSGHQSANAKIYEENNAAVVLSEKSLTGSSLLSIINRLMEDDPLRQLLGHHARQFSKNATEEIIEILYELQKRG